MEDTRDRVLSFFLVLGIFYFVFMNLDRVLSLVYGFNFQPYGEYAPPGFTYWGHLVNGSIAATGLFLTFKLDEVGRKRGKRLIQFSGYAFYALIIAYIPYINDAEHLAKKRGRQHPNPVPVSKRHLRLHYGLALIQGSEHSQKEGLRCRVTRGRVPGDPLPPLRPPVPRVLLGLTRRRRVQ